MVTTTTAADLLHGEVTERVIAGFYKAYNALGYGLLERVYRRSIQVALEKGGLPVRSEVPFSVYFMGENVGDYRADLVVDERVIVECKSVEHVLAVHEAQILNYLRASGLRVGLLLNFGPKPTFKRFMR
jgi:GxxExxY protein